MLCRIVTRCRMALNASKRLIAYPPKPHVPHTRVAQEPKTELAYQFGVSSNTWCGALLTPNRSSLQMPLNKTKTNFNKRKPYTRAKPKKLVSAPTANNISGAMKAMSRARPKPRKSMVSYAPRVGPSMSTQTAKYLAALHHPFLPAATNSHIPDAFCLPSHKYSVRLVGKFSTGATGSGGIAFWPFRLAFTDYITNGNFYYPAVKFTNVNYAQTDHSYTNQAYLNSLVPTVGVESEPQNSHISIYSSSQFTGSTGRALRLVGAGLRVTPTGPVLNRAGTVTYWRNPSASQGLDTNYDTFENLMALRSATIVECTSVDSSHGITYIPILPTDFNAVLASVEGIPVVSTDNPYICNRLAGGIAIDGYVNGTFTYEAIAHFEAYGRAIPVSSNLPDVNGHAGALAGAKTEGHSSNLSQSLSTAVSSLGRGMTSLIPSVSTGAKQGFQEALPALAKRAAAEGAKSLISSLLR